MLTTTRAMQATARSMVGVMPASQGSVGVLPASTSSITSCNGHGFKSSKPAIKKICTSAQATRH